MKFQVKIGDLVEQITQAEITVDSKATGQFLSKVYLRAFNKPVTETKKEPALYLFSTDQSCKTFIKIKVESVTEEGKVLIDADKLLGSLIGRDKDQTVELSIVKGDDGKPSRIKVKVGKNVAHLPYDGAVDEMDKTIKSLPKGDPFAKISAKTLIEFIRRSNYCIPIGENGQQQFAMSALSLKSRDDSYIAQATDGRIIAYHTAKQTETTKYTIPSMLIPQRALDPLQKLLQRHKEADIELLTGAKTPKGDLQEIFFRMDGVLFGTVLRSGKHPDVTLVLKDHVPSYECKIDREGLKQALVRAANFVENANDKRSVKLSPVSETLIKIEASNVISDLNDQLDITSIDGEFATVTVAISLDYLANAAAVQSGEMMTVGFNVAKDKAIVIKDDTESIDTRYAIMPVRADVKAADKKAKDE